MLGQDSVAVLRAYAFGEPEIESLLSRRVVVQNVPTQPT
jgi:hypothetical protein